MASHYDDILKQFTFRKKRIRHNSAEILANTIIFIGRNQCGMLKNRQENVEMRQCGTQDKKYCTFDFSF